MKKFISKTLIILLPIIISLFFLELILRQIPNDYEYKASYLEQNANQIEGLVLGSSHSFYGVNPIYFPDNVFNASHAGQSLDYDYEILMKYRNQFRNLQTIYIPISYFTFWSRLKNGKEAWRCQLYIDSYGLKKDMRIKGNFKVSSNFRTNVTRAIRYLRTNKTDRTCSNLGWGTNYNSAKARNLIESGETAAERHTRDNIDSKENTTVFYENEIFLKDIILWSKSRDINVILFTPPAFETYRKNLNSKQLKTAIETATQIANDFESCTYINMLEDSSFIAKDFYDADHLSEIGAEKLTKKLNEMNNARTHNILYNQCGVK